MLVKIIQALIDFAGIVLNSVIGLLPNSPFSWDFSWLGSWWGFVNYFIPFQAMASFTLYYVAAVGIWYAVRWIMRIIRYIG